jgi:hypothetical protein
MDAPYQVRLRQVQLVIAAVDEHPLRIKNRAHGSVAQQGGISKALKKLAGHS